MGRVIRHRYDYGAILLCDERFSSTNNQRQLSRWLRDYLVCHSNFGQAIGSLTKFFKVQGVRVHGLRSWVCHPGAVENEKGVLLEGFGVQSWLCY